MRRMIRPGFTLSYDERGDRRAEALVLVSGTGSTKDGWGTLPEELAARHRVISFDCRGLGDSDPGPDPLSATAVADDIAAILDDLAVPRSHVLGWSFGSTVAQHFAVRHPDRLGALVLWSTWARTDGYLRATFTGLRYPFAQADLDTAVIALGTVFSPELLNSPEFGALVEQMQPTLPHTESQMRATVQQWDANLGHDTTERLPEVTAPVLVFAGEQDTLSPPRYGREVVGLLPRARFELFSGPGSSHALGLERPDEFCELVLDFLAQHSFARATTTGGPAGP